MMAMSGKWARLLSLAYTVVRSSSPSMFTVAVFGLSTALSCGCAAKRTALTLTPPVPTWQDHYQGVEPVITRKPVEEQAIDLVVSWNSESATVADVLRHLSNVANVSIVCDESIAQKKVSLRLEKVQWKTAISLTARSAAADVIFRDGVWIVGQPGAADASLLIRRVRGLSAADIEKALGTVLDQQRRRVVYQDGLVVIADSAGTLVRVSMILDELEAARVPQWAIQLYLVTLTSRDAQELGIEATPALDLAVSQAIGSATAVEPVKLNASLKTVLRASAERSTMSVTAQPLFLLLDGSSASFNRGTQVPIPQRTVSDNGTVSDTGVQFVSVGTDVKISIREAGAKALRLDLDLSLSDLVEVTSAGYPRTDQRSYKAPCIVEDGGTYLLAAVEMGRKRKSVTNMLRWGQADDDSAELLHVWCRCRRVGGPALLPEVGSEVGSEISLPPVEAKAPQILAVPAKKS